MRRRWRWLSIPAALAAAVLGVLAWRRPPTYTATAAFLPEPGQGQSRLTALAAQFAIPLGPSGDAGESPQFFVEVLQSAAFLRQFADTALPTAIDGRTIRRPVSDVLGVPAGPEPQRVEETAHRIAGIVSSSASPRTSVVSIVVTTRDPVFSAALATALLGGINEFNLRMRQRRASAELEFTQERLTAARQNVLSAQDRLQRFIQQNQLFRSSSRLSLEQERLAQAVSAAQGLYASLLQAEEQARIDDLRRTPLISVVAAPYVPPLPDSRGVARMIVLGLIAGFATGLSAALLLEMTGPPAALSEIRSDEGRTNAAPPPDRVAVRGSAR